MTSKQRNKAVLDYQHLSKHITSAMHEASVPGLGIAVVERSEIIYDQVFGFRNTHTRPMLTQDTQFQAASLSKPVFAYAVLKLFEKGLIDLNTPLSKYTSEPYSQDKRSLEITPRQVLSHSTGFPNWRSDTSLKIEVPPGKTFGYSGEGYVYLQKVVEQLTSQPLHGYLQDNFFEPLGMKNSTFAWGIDENGQFLLDEDGNVLSPTGSTSSNAAFSLLTTASDYARFLLAILNPQENHPFKLNKASVTAMLSPQLQVGRYNSLSWGLGWGVQHTQMGDAFWHWGGPQNNYFNYCFVFKGQGLGVVILTNDDSGLDICESVAQVALSNWVPHPAFDWLLPIESFHPRGY